MMYNLWKCCFNFGISAIASLTIVVLFLSADYKVDEHTVLAMPFIKSGISPFSLDQY
jgi:hypothetical protein